MTLTLVIILTTVLVECAIVKYGMKYGFASYKRKVKTKK